MSIVSTNDFFLILLNFRSTSEKISYHFIHADPSVLFENNITLGLFIKGIIHYCLCLIAQHKCLSFNINFVLKKYTISDLLSLLEPFVNTLRTGCINCQLYSTYITISEFAYLLVLNKNNKLTLAIDLNVYSNNQNFRLFDCVKIGKSNALRESTYYQFNNKSDNSYVELIHKSLITFVQGVNVPIVNFKNYEFFKSSIDKINLQSESNYNCLFFNNLNGHLKNFFMFNSKAIINSNLNKLDVTPHANKHISIDLNTEQLKDFTSFVNKLIKSDKFHEGYIGSCVRGTINNDLLFFNISGNFRFCPYKGTHHRKNTVAILINTKQFTYTIRCKDYDCNNKSLIWKKIE